MQKPKSKPKTKPASAVPYHVPPKVVVVVFAVVVLIIATGSETEHCSGTGRWDSVSNVCVCDYGYSGTQCQEWSCRESLDCGGSANKCVRGKCVCASGSAQGPRCDGRPQTTSSRVYGQCYPSRWYQPWAPSGSMMWMLLAVGVMAWLVYHPDLSDAVPAQFSV